MVIPFAEQNMNLHCSDFFKLSEVFIVSHADILQFLSNVVGNNGS